VTQILLAGVVFFAAHLLSTVTGFGAGILGLPLLTFVVGLTPARQSMVVLGGLLYVYLTLRWRAAVDARELGRILLLAVPGVSLGMAVYEYLPARVSMALLGAFVVGVTVHGMVRGPVARPARGPGWTGRLMLFLGGAVHGAFTTGGPLLVVYCRRALPGKSAFRATLAAMWVLLAVILAAEWTVTRAWDPATPRLTLAGFPFLVAGGVVGEYLHHRVDARTFATAVHLTLLATGGLLLWSAVR
jgi:uncharacterized membrane protein YfcA